jgi:hypothetical protein
MYGYWMGVSQHDVCIVAEEMQFAYTGFGTCSGQCAACDSVDSGLLSIDGTRASAAGEVVGKTSWLGLERSIV